ncbi:prephenate dehydrogenase [Aeromicrobium alkaliterrae]|uniref:Prephenate dehydrogenase n=1 Tax=Aeromicrobium alkaliterrae TaxID=302168 RepID=A0ABN2JJS2_9ACTN
MTATDLPGSALVVGCGLIGTSVALALTARGVDVHLRDAVPGVAEVASSIGAGSVEPVTDPDLVVVAVPPTVVPATVLSALQEFPHAVVTDVASVKRPVAAAVAGTPGAERFVGGHPMAGTERSGPTAGSALLFEGRPWAVVPLPESTPEAVALVTAVVSALEAVPTSFAPDEHDEAVALVSHVPHLVSVLTAGLLASAPRAHIDLAGPGLRDVTRIAGSATGMWLQILDSNSAAVTTLLQSLRGDLDRVLDALGAGGDVLTGRLSDVLDAGRAGTQRIPGKHGEVRTESASVFVPVEDRPGVLSQLMSDIGESGVNIEDFRIDHEYGRPVGLAQVEVAADRADHLTSSLTARGWSAYR